MRRRGRVGLLPPAALVLLAAFAFGTQGVFGRLFFEHGGEPLALLAVRFSVGGAVFLALAARRRIEPPMPGWLKAAILAGMFQFAAAFALFEGFERAQIGIVVLLLYIYPLLVGVGSSVLFAEPLGRRWVLMAGICLGGVALVLGSPGDSTATGVALGVCAGVAGGAQILAGKYLLVKGMTAAEVVAFMYVIATALVLPAILIGDVSFAADTWGWLAVAGAVVLGGILPSLWFYAGIRGIDAGRASLLATMEPLSAMFLAFLVLGETLSWPQLVGAALILSGIVAVSRTYGEPRPG